MEHSPQSRVGGGSAAKKGNNIEPGRGHMNLWDRILASMQAKMNSQTFNTWLRPTQQLSVADGLLHVEVPSVHFADWINKNYMPLIEESARELEVGDLRLSFTSRETGARRAGPPPAPERRESVLSQLATEDIFRTADANNEQLRWHLDRYHPRPGYSYRKAGILF